MYYLETKSYFSYSYKGCLNNYTTGCLNDSSSVQSVAFAIASLTWDVKVQSSKFVMRRLTA